MSTTFLYINYYFPQAKIKNNVCLALPTQDFTWWVMLGRHFFFFLNIMIKIRHYKNVWEKRKKEKEKETYVGDEFH